MNPIGPLIPADESLCHQIADTFSVVESTDLAWTEKVCAMAAARDGSLQFGFGLGKYANRNVMDAYAGISRGIEQITVRASRRLAPEPASTVIGPIRYEILEPLRSVRFSLEPNSTQPIAFDCVFQAIAPPAFEDRTVLRTGYRTATDLVRYHQIGLASGWIEVDGVRTNITPEDWVCTRDHSWGVRHGVGRPVGDVEAVNPMEAFHFFWTPSYLERPDGTAYGLFLLYGDTRRPGEEHKFTFGLVEHPDGRTERIVNIRPELSYRSDNRRLTGGRVHATMEDGTHRTFQVEVVSETGFHLGTGLYFGFDGHFHGEWRGDLHIDGERIASCADPDTARRVHQIRDTVVRITDPVGGGVGWGNWQPIAYGHLPELGLSGETSFM